MHILSVRKMSQAWKEAKKYADNLSGYPDIVLQRELEKSNFRQGEFAINSYTNGGYLGMISPGMRRPFDKERYDKISAFAKERQLKVVNRTAGVVGLLRIQEICEGGTFVPHETVVANLHEDCFYAIEPEIFEEIGKAIYGLKSE